MTNETALAKSQTTDMHFGGYEREQVNVIKATIARGTSDAELALFCMTSKRVGLDPFAKQIYAIMRYDSRAGKEVMTILTAIDGYRVVAHRTGEYDGIDGPYWCGPDGEWKEIWLSDKPPYAAKVSVWRKGIARPFVGIARFRAYAQTDKSGNLVGKWPVMPDHMIGKCAEALGLRKAFPNELSGTNVPEEMGAIDAEYTESFSKPEVTSAAPVGQPKAQPGPAKQEAPPRRTESEKAPMQETMREAQSRAADEKAKQAAAEKQRKAEAERAYEEAQKRENIPVAEPDAIDAEIEEDFPLDPTPPAPTFSVEDFRKKIAAAGNDENKLRAIKAEYLPWVKTPEGAPFAGAIKDIFVKATAGLGK